MVDYFGNGLNEEGMQLTTSFRGMPEICSTWPRNMKGPPAAGAAPEGIDQSSKDTSKYQSKQHQILSPSNTIILHQPTTIHSHILSSSKGYRGSSYQIFAPPKLQRQRSLDKDCNQKPIQHISSTEHSVPSLQTTNKCRQFNSPEGSTITTASTTTTFHQLAHPLIEAQLQTSSPIIPPTSTVYSIRKQQMQTISAQQLCYQQQTQQQQKQESDKDLSVNRSSNNSPSSERLYQHMNLVTKSFNLPPPPPSPSYSHSNRDSYPPSGTGDLDLANMIIQPPSLSPFNNPNMNSDSEPGSEQTSSFCST